MVDYPAGYEPQMASIMPMNVPPGFVLGQVLSGVSQAGDKAKKEREEKAQNLLSYYMKMAEMGQQLPSSPELVQAWETATGMPYPGLQRAGESPRTFDQSMGFSPRPMTQVPSGQIPSLYKPETSNIFRTKKELEKELGTPPDGFVWDIKSSIDAKTGKQYFYSGGLARKSTAGSSSSIYKPSQIENDISKINTRITTLQGQKASVVGNLLMPTEEKTNRLKEIDSEMNALRQRRDVLAREIQAKTGRPVGSFGVNQPVQTYQPTQVVSQERQQNVAPKKKDSLGIL